MNENYNNLRQLQRYIIFLSFTFQSIDIFILKIFDMLVSFELILFCSEFREALVKYENSESIEYLIRLLKNVRNHKKIGTDFLNFYLTYK